MYATADALTYDSAAALAVYTGNAQLWQGETTIKGDTIVVDDQKGDLSASGRVVSKMMLEQVDSKTKAKEQVPLGGDRAARWCTRIGSAG